MIRIGIVGLGKMGLSHLAMFKAHPDVDLAGVCDSSGYVLDVLGKYTGVPTYKDYGEMIRRTDLDAVVIATPSHLHAAMVRTALEAGLHVFCEKPFCLNDADGEALTKLAADRGLVTQVGYHNRYVGSFGEVKRLLELGAIGEVTHGLAEAYGPVVLKPKGGTWRSKKSAGGGCLYDYAAHPIDLVTWYLGAPDGVSGSRLNSIFSAEIDDEVTTSIQYPGDSTVQVSVNWSDESQRKMTTRLTLWGTTGRIFVDRQEIHVYLRDTATVPEGYRVGWNVKYTTELTEPVWYYLRGEEYSAQVADFVTRVAEGRQEGTNTFATAARTDKVLSLIARDAASPGGLSFDDGAPERDGTPLPGRAPAGSAEKRPLWRRRRPLVGQGGGR
jgi:predicted dehydrogenase